jgi:hypothetical protein
MNEGLYVCRPHLPVYELRVTRLKIIEKRHIMPGRSFMSNLDALGSTWGFDLRRFALVILILLMWGLPLLHPTDNVLRPLLISNATHVPFIIVMFGVIGGVAASGLVGVFVGPIVLALGLAIWRSWASGDETTNGLVVEGRGE